MSDEIGLVGDIGRQSVRFAISEGATRGAPRDVRSYNTADHSSFTGALTAYLAEVGLSDVALPCVLAVAGSVRSDLINLTGSRWYVSLSGVAAVLRVQPRAMNECAATALALTALAPGDLATIGKNPPRIPRPGGNYLTVAIGTGLGVAALVSGADGRLTELQGEAGHMTFSPTTEEEARFSKRITKRGPLSAETLLSASGLVHAYEALADRGQTAESPEKVTASIDRDPISAAVVRMFVGYLGSFIGDLVLAYGAWDGVYLTGPIAKALRASLNDSRFQHRLEAKDAFRRQLSDVPVAMVDRSDLVLLGAATALRRQSAQQFSG
jgi:glucokinase